MKLKIIYTMSVYLCQCERPSQRQDVCSCAQCLLDRWTRQTGEEWCHSQWMHLFQLY